MGWGDDVEDKEDDDDGQTELSDFKPSFEKSVRGSGSVNDLDEGTLNANIDQIEDEDLLREAWLQADGPHQTIIEKRIEDIGGSTPEGNSQSTSENTSDTSTDSNETESESESSDDGSWGGTPEGESSESPQPAVESMDEMEEEKDSEEDESAQSEDMGLSSDSGGPPVPQNAISPEEAADRDRRWKIMVWGPPKLFKTHFCYTMPEPIAFLDLEGKADDLARKFKGKEIQIWQPKSMTAKPDTKFRRAKKALDEALEWLDWWREEQGETGTIVVDSMSLMWEWAQIHHKIENYPLKDEEDIELSSNFNSSQESDWAVIKEYHNGEFRERITDSPYHFCWTAMERLDFERQFEEGDGNAQFMEPTGEPKNTYKADTIIRARKDSDRGKVGDLTGSNFTDNVFVGLEKPTFPKVSDAIDRIEAAESGEEEASRSQLADEIGAESIIDYDPQMFVNNK